MSKVLTVNVVGITLDGGVDKGNKIEYKRKTGS